MRVQKTPPSDKRRIYIGVALVALLTTLFLAMMILFKLVTGIEDPFAGLSVSVLCFLVLYTALSYLLIIRVGVEKIGGLGFLDLHWRGHSWSRDILIGISGALVGSICLFLLGWLSGSWSWPEFWLSELSFSFQQRVLFLLIGLNAGLIEETLFRGYLQPALIRNMGGILGLVLASLLFALYHLNFHPLGFGGKLVLGLVFGALRGEDRPLIRSSIAHAGVWVLVGAV